MSPIDLDAALDAMAAKARGDAQQLPGLVTVRTDDWVKSLADLRATCSALHDGMRYRDIVVHVGSQEMTQVLTRMQAEERGQPFRHLQPRPE